MKEQDIHSVLWQKRNEFRIIDDVQHDWLDMQAMLDVQMPVVNQPAGGGGLSGLSGLKLLSVVLATLGVATLVYFASHKNEPKNNNHKNNTTTTIVNKTTPTPNSISTNNRNSLSGATSSSGLNNNSSTNTNRDKVKSDLPSSNTTTGNTEANSALAGNHAVVSANNHSAKTGAGIAYNKTAGSNANAKSSLTKGNTGSKNVIVTGSRLTTSGTGAVAHHHTSNHPVASNSDLTRHGQARSPHAVNGTANANNMSKLKGNHSSGRK
jgi:hypothetical protein